MKIGVLSDTHGRLDPKIITVFAGVERILHAGDIGSNDVLAGLEKVAPVEAVRGNGDASGLLDLLPEKRILWLAGKKVLLTHIGDPTEELIQVLDGEGPLDSFDLVICGHTHGPEMRMRDGTLFFNPGAASRKMCYLAPSVGRITLENGEIQGELIPLET